MKTMFMTLISMFFIFNVHSILAQNSDNKAKPEQQEVVREVPVKIMHFDEIKESEEKKEQAVHNQPQSETERPANKQPAKKEEE